MGLNTIAVATVDDFLAWVFIAAASSTIGTGSKLDALWVLISTLAFVVLALLFGPWIYNHLAHISTHSDHLSQQVMVITFALLLTFGFITELIGVHYIFGGFIAGLIVPHEHEFTVAVTEKVEDFVAIVALPIFFATSGLKTNFTLLNSGLDWAFIGVLILAGVFGKVFFGAVAARLMGMSNGESFKLGMLMNTVGIFLEMLTYI